MKSFSSEEAAPVGDISGSKDKMDEQVNNKSEKSKVVEENPVPNQENQQDESSAVNDAPLPQDSSTLTDEALLDEAPTAPEEEKKDEEQQELPKKEEVKPSDETIDEQSPSSKEQDAVESTEKEETPAASDDVETIKLAPPEPEKVTMETTEVEQGAFVSPSPSDVQEFVPEPDAIGPIIRSNSPSAEDVEEPTISSNNDTPKGGDVEEGIPSEIGVQKAPDPPESPPRDKNLSVEQGVPPETPVKPNGAKEEYDPESPSRDTEPDDSFDSSMEQDDGENEASAKTKKRRHRTHLIFGTISVIIVVGALLGILYGTGVVGKSEPASSTGVPAPPPPPSDGSTPGDDSPPAPTPTGESPTEPPTQDSLTNDPLFKTLEGFGLGGLDDTNSPQFKAYQWMRQKDPISLTNNDPARLGQRYAMATLYSSLLGEIPFYATRDECSWPSVECNTHNTTNMFGSEASWRVTEVNMAGQSLTGSIPREIGLLPSLISLDMAENPDLTGSIPDELYELNYLRYLYLTNNGMSGTLSENISNLYNLDSLYLGGNKFSGTIPYNLGSRQEESRPLRKSLTEFLCVYVSRRHLTFAPSLFFRPQGS